jgi:hypothetical protein
MMKLLFITLLFSAGVAQAQVVIQSEPVYIAAGKDNYLMAEISPPTTEFPGIPTHCSGWLHEGDHSDTPYTIPDTPLQTTQPKCKINITNHLKVGTMTWYACSVDYNQTMGGHTTHPTSCNSVPLRFTVAQGSGGTGPAPLSPPSNLRQSTQ